MEMSTTTTIRVSRKTRDTLQNLANQYGTSMQAILEEAVDLLEGQRLLEATYEAYAKLRANPEAWQELQEERAQWDVTLSDGLEGLE
jgi:predicted transcriptional regulator